MEKNEQNDHGKKEDHKKDIIIIVNTREKTWDEKEISYEQVVELAFGTYTDHPDIVYTITYSKGPDSHHEGSLVKGRSVHVKNGMIFNVTKTDKS